MLWLKAFLNFLKRGESEYGDENLREKIYENYRIVYRLKGELIELVAISHGAKLLNQTQ